MTKPLRVLVVDDSAEQTRLIGEELSLQGLRVKWERVQTSSQMIGALGVHSWDVVISELQLAQMNAADALKVLHQLELDTPLFVVTAHPEEAAVEVMKSGARDIFSPDKLARLGPAILRELEGLEERAEQQDAVETLRQERDCANKLFETAQAIVLVLDTEGRIIRFNPYLEQLSGYTLAQVRGKPWISTFLPQRRQAGPGALFKAAPPGLPVSGSTGVILTRDGQEREIEWYDTPLNNSAGRVMGLLAIGHDVTDRRRTEGDLALADRMANMGLLAAGVAHEINNPLTYVLFNLERLRSCLPPLTSALNKCQVALGPERTAELLGEEVSLTGATHLADTQRLVDEAAGGAESVRRIVRALRTFARVDDDRIVPLSLNNVLESAINIVYNEIRFRARLRKDFGELPTIMANDGTLAQVFVNLIINAAHAIDEGDVEHNSISVRTWIEGQQVACEIKDTGKGISREILPRIFDPFFTTKNIGAGSGLGLAICQNIINAHEGAIEVSSEEGRGTTFTVRLPVAVQPQPEARRQPSPALQSGARGKFLIVDDEDHICKALQQIIADEHEVCAVTSGVKAQQLLDHNRHFDGIICDLMMPEFTGMDLHEWLTRIAPPLAEKMIFITGGAFTPHARQFLQRVSNPRLEKPFDSQSLKAILRQMVS